MPACVKSRSTAVLLGTALVALTLGQAARASTYEAFANPQAVTITGWTGSAMEPEISQDGNYLLFNSTNVPPAIPALQYAVRVAANTFQYEGPVAGAAVNEPGILSGTPSLDADGNLYFVSPRSYPETLSTIYTGQFTEGTVTGLHLVSGITGEAPGIVDFDVAVSPDGSAIYTSVGDYSGGSLTAAHIALFDRSGTGFTANPEGVHLLHAVNRPGALDYAPSVSANGLELFFTRATPARGVRGEPGVYRASRASTARPFGHVQRVGAITGYAEAPSLSGDGTTLYYHQLAGSTFRIMTVTRAPAPAERVRSSIADV